MVALSSFFNAVIFTSNIVVHGFNESSCPEKAIVDLTRNISEEFPKNLTWSRDDGSIGCYCDIKTCVTLCCGAGMGQVDGWLCVNDNVTSFETLPTIENLPYKDFHPIVDNPCSFNWMAPSVLTEFAVLPNGSLHVSDYAGGSQSYFELEQYCIFRRPGSDQFLAKVCRPWVRRDHWDIVALVIATLVMLTIFIGFTRIPELKNLHGLIFRCYVAAYIGMYICALGAEFTTQNRTLPVSLYVLIDTTTRYCGCCCIFWLNVMSFNMWRSFRCLRPIDPCLPRFERKLFIWYTVYACVTPAVFIVIGPAVILHTLPQFRDDILRYNFKNWGCAALAAAIFASNGLFCVSTALRIRQHAKDTAHFVQGVNRHREVDRQWFNLYLKLFFVMGGHLLIWPVWFVLPTPEITHIFAVLEVLQSILIFVIFLWKPNYELVVRKRSSLPGLSPKAHSSTTVKSSEAVGDRM